ncbi:MAG: VanZ family protein [Clostridia bacterium]|nr:VanZ family protein [Clostridia bacterium]
MAQSKSGRTVMVTLFLLYSGIMLCMLFGRSTHNSGADYWHSVWENINIIPLKTTIDFFRDLFDPSDCGQFRHACINLFGNIAVFVPLGIFLPCIWEFQRRFCVFFCTASVIILAVECLQLFTLRGICDVDDFLLNLLGISVGFALYLWSRRLRKSE